MEIVLALAATVVGLKLGGLLLALLLGAGFVYGAEYVPPGYRPRVVAVSGAVLGLLVARGGLLAAALSAAGGVLLGHAAESLVLTGSFRQATLTLPQVEGRLRQVRRVVRLSALAGVCATALAGLVAGTSWAATVGLAAAASAAKYHEEILARIEQWRSRGKLL